MQSGPVLGSMNASRRLTALLASTWLGAGLLAAPGAAADGLPMVDLDTSRIGITDRSGQITYYALPAGKQTEILRTGAEPDAAGRTLRQRTVDGTLAIPGVAWDGTTSGLSSLGGRLVLIEPRKTFPRASTRLLMVDSTTLRTIADIDLNGDYSFDAVSPDGGLVYLIHYFDPKDPSVYEVRAWDVEAERLLPEPIIDERTAPQVMRGYPMTRATSPDGQWEYTLYDGGGKKPFVHALNTADATALCIDLPALDGRYVSGYTLVPSPDGSEVTIRNRKEEAVASFGTSDWKATGTEEGHTDHDAAAASPDDESPTSPVPPVVVASLALLALTLTVATVWRRQRRGPSRGWPGNLRAPSNAGGAGVRRFSGQAPRAEAPRAEAPQPEPERQHAPTP
jgi:hypothetical protein